MGAKKVMVVTDGTVLKLDAMKQVQEGLEREGIAYEIFSRARVEPKDYSWVFSFSFLASRTLVLCLDGLSCGNQVGVANVRRFCVTASKKQSTSPSPTNPTPSSL